MRAYESAKPTWPPPPSGVRLLRVPRKRTPGLTFVETAHDSSDDRDDEPTRWYHHPLLTIAAFLVFPPLGLFMAIRFHGLLGQHIAVRLAVVAMTVGLLFIPYGASSGGDAGSGITDGAPIVGQVEPADFTSPNPLV